MSTCFLITILVVKCLPWDVVLVVEIPHILNVEKLNIIVSLRRSMHSKIYKYNRFVVLSHFARNADYLQNMFLRWFICFWQFSPIHKHTDWLKYISLLRYLLKSISAKFMKTLSNNMFTHTSVNNDINLTKVSRS